MSEPERLAEVGRWLRFAGEDLSTAELNRRAEQAFPAGVLLRSTGRRESDKGDPHLLAGRFPLPP